MNYLESEQEKCDQFIKFYLFIYFLANDKIKAHIGINSLDTSNITFLLLHILMYNLYNLN